MSRLPPTHTNRDTVTNVTPCHACHAAILQTYLADGSLVGNITGESITPFRLELGGYFDYILTSGSGPLRIGPMAVTGTVPEPPVTLLVLAGLVCLTQTRKARVLSDAFTSKAYNKHSATQNSKRQSKTR